jgi:hypothetical protein
VDILLHHSSPGYVSLQATPFPFPNKFNEGPRIVMLSREMFPRLMTFAFEQAGETQSLART